MGIYLPPKQETRKIKKTIMKYDSKISYGLVMFILVILVGSSIPLILNQLWTGLIINIIVMAFITHLFLTTYYIIDNRILKVKSGFLINKKIDINTIKSISETNSPISAPAASLDRLAIKYLEFNIILISPKDKSGFIDHITRINSEIEIHFKAGNS
jgi:hypothetical protein